MSMDIVRPDEPLSRFILSKSHFSREKQRVKYGAFMPSSNGETSVFRTSNLTNNQIWNLGDTHVAQERRMQLLGRGDIQASAVFEKGLKIAADNNPQRHANIKGWPGEKSERLLIATELAVNAALHLK